MMMLNDDDYEYYEEDEQPSAMTGKGIDGLGDKSIEFNIQNQSSLS